jgi:ubiquinone/menaquinone biosynthesis C-methylase UbiE
MSTSSTFVAHDGDGYELLMGRWSSRLAPRFVAFAGVGDQHRQVLDVGCGTGHLARTIAERQAAAQVQGVDLSPAYVDHARRRHHAEPRLAFDVGDACALAFPDARFDAVLSLLVLHFVPQPERAVAEMRRVARPGGVVAATVWDARGGFVANRLFWDTAAAVDPQALARRARNYTRPMTRPGELAQAWRDAGLQDVHADTIGIRMDFADFDDFWAPYLGQDGPGAEYVSTLDGPMRDRVRDAVRAAYLDGEDDGPRSFAALAWAVRGTVPAA